MADVTCGQMHMNWAGMDSFLWVYNAGIASYVEIIVFVFVLLL